MEKITSLKENPCCNESPPSRRNQSEPRREREVRSRTSNVKRMNKARRTRFRRRRRNHRRDVVPNADSKRGRRPIWGSSFRGLDLALGLGTIFLPLGGSTWIPVCCAFFKAGAWVGGNTNVRAPRWAVAGTCSLPQQNATTFPGAGAGQSAPAEGVPSSAETPECKSRFLSRGERYMTTSRASPSIPVGETSVVDVNYLVRYGRLSSQCSGSH